MQDSMEPAPADGRRDPDDRLESWKRIAAYLQRDVRTLRRWERSEGLPVHRQMHDKLGTVYAYKSELDAWRAARTLDEPAERGLVQRWRRLMPALAVLALFGAAAVLLAWWRVQAPALPLADRDWVLVTQFDNRTGEALFDDSLEHALERELSNSRFVNVVPRDRVGDTLRLMQLPLDTRVDADLGREVSLRDGGIRVLVTGRIERFGERYLLSTSLIEAASGRIVAGFERDAGNIEQILPAIAGLAREVREALGESLSGIAGSGGELARVTTPSLEALRLYSQADALMQQFGRYAQALPLLEQALAFDPDFASAHVHLWYVLRDLGEDERAARHIARAMELSDGLADRERYFIIATWHESRGDLRAVIDALETLVQLHPDHFWAVGNLGFAYLRSGDWRRSAEMRLRRAELRPNHPIVQLDAATLATLAGDHERAAVYEQRVRELVGARSEDAWMLVSLDLFPVKRHWLRGDLDAARAELERVEARDTGNGRFTIRALYLALGDMGKFAALAPRAGAPDWLHTLAYLDDPRFLNAFLDGVAERFYPLAAFHARAGRLEEARTMLRVPVQPGRFRSPYMTLPWRMLEEGELALASGDTAQAVGKLETATTWMRAVPTSYYFLAVESLARAYERSDGPERAIRALETANGERHRSIFHPGATFAWMRTRVQLADLYRRNGREDAALQVERELRELLRLADPTHPIVVALQRTSSVTADAS